MKFKLLVAVVFIALLAAAYGKRFELQPCILVDVDAIIDVTAERNETVQHNVSVNVSELESNITGECGNDTATAQSITIKFNNSLSWRMAFMIQNDSNTVVLDHLITYIPEDLFNATVGTGEVDVASTNISELSSVNTSFICNATQTIAFNSSQPENNFTFTVVLHVSNLHVQAFGEPNGTFAPAEECSADLVNSTTAIITTQEVTTSGTITTEAPPHVEPAPDQTFIVVNNATQTTCIKMIAGIQILVEYNTTDNKMIFSKPIPVTNETVSGVCAENSTDTATMIIANKNNNITLEINVTAVGNQTSVSVQLTLQLDSDNFPNASQAGEKVTFLMSNFLQLSDLDTYYLCNALDSKQFENSRTALYVNNVQLQAFNLSNGDFSGNVSECSQDPTTTSTSTTSATTISTATTVSPVVPPDTYFVHEGNVTCIVFQGNIIISGIAYNRTDNTTGTASVHIPPAINTTMSGSCSSEGPQQLSITFHNNTLSLTFALSEEDYFLKDIVFDYILTDDLFPNASQPNASQTIQLMNITGEFLKGKKGGSYKCNANVEESLGNGAKFETTNLQYKAFNVDNVTSFSNDNVLECSADDESNSIVPIAVGAALAGLVLIVLIAYLIGRRRSRRQGYESV